MRTIKTILLGFCFFVGGATSLWAQQTPVASGGEATGAGGTVSYSIGQANYITDSGIGGTVTQGVQQPFEIVAVNGIELTNIKLSYAVYPNPTTNSVVLSVENADIQNMSYSLFDVEGRLIAEQKLSGTKTTIQMEELLNAIYFIKVINNNNVVKVFKVLKRA